MIKHINSEEFDTEVIKNDNKLIIVDFFATWCGPCQRISPILEDIAKKREDIDILKIDIDKNVELSVKYGIEFVPTLLAFKNGKMISQIQAVPDEKLLLEQIDKL